MATLFELPIRRPIATVMCYATIVLLGVVAWMKLPAELLPALPSQRVQMSILRPGSDSDTVEREILAPLEARVRALPEVAETSAEVRGASGTLDVRFRSSADLAARRLDVQRVSAEVARTQPPGTTIDVNAANLSTFSRFAMSVLVTGGQAPDQLFEAADSVIRPQLASVEGVGRVLIGGAAPREATIWLDADRLASNGLTPDQAVAAVERWVAPNRLLGWTPLGDSRRAVVLEGRIGELPRLGDVPIGAAHDVRLRQVADLSLAPGRVTTAFRVNGRPSVGLLLFQQENANLVRLGRALRERIERIREELKPAGIAVLVQFDGAAVIETELSDLMRRALHGFAISLVVLFLFARQLRAVLVVAVAVPVSVVAALALLFVGGQSLNAITLFGLAVAIGLIIDNGIVVFEAIQRLVERGATPGRAASEAVGRTVRAIVAAAAMNTVVFLPVAAIEGPDSLLQSMLAVLALAIVLPLLASVMVAVGLVPMLTRWYSAPAAQARVAALLKLRESDAGRLPDRIRALFMAIVRVGLRRPVPVFVATAAVVVITTVVALPWIAVVTGNEPPADTPDVRVTVDLLPPASVEAASSIFDRLDTTALAVPHVARVESFVQEAGGALIVRLDEKAFRSGLVSAEHIRQALLTATRGLDGVRISLAAEGASRSSGSGSGADALGGASVDVRLLGVDSDKLMEIAEELRARLESMPDVGTAYVASQPARPERHLTPNVQAAAALGVFPDLPLKMLGVLRREGVPMRDGLVQDDGTEWPLLVRRLSPPSGDDLSRLPLTLGARTLPARDVMRFHDSPPPPVITWHNGRRAVTVVYELSGHAPQAGPARQDLERRIRTTIAQTRLPPGYTIEVPDQALTLEWLLAILGSAAILVFVVLAVVFESLTLPWLVMLTVPLTIAGGAWALVITGRPADTMALVGVLVLLGLSGNPAILLVDRMQARMRRGCWTAGAAALATVHERGRPVLMTTATAVVGLLPLALSPDAARERWPSFAVVVIGGLVASTVLTLLVVPIGFVALRRLDRMFARVGPWTVCGWAVAAAVATVAVMTTDVLGSFAWRAIIAVVFDAALLAAVAAAVPRSHAPQRQGPTILETRCLAKRYGGPGPIARAWVRSSVAFRAGAHRSISPLERRWASDRLRVMLPLLAGTIWAGLLRSTAAWQVPLFFVASLIAAHAVRVSALRWMPGRDVRAVKACAHMAAPLFPWMALLVSVWRYGPWTSRGEIGLPALAVLAGVMLIAQLGRRTALSTSNGAGVARHGLAGSKLGALWRRAARLVCGFDVPRSGVLALERVNVRLTPGLIGVLGPNGAGKTTFLRLLVGILEPTHGRVLINGVPLTVADRSLTMAIGYLPQEFGLPLDLTAREYLAYYARLHDIVPAAERSARIVAALREVGLAAEADRRISALSGGMRQRLAIARVLLRPPSILVVDEPTVGLDPAERVRLRNLLVSLAAERIVLFSTHLVDDVAVACNRVLVLSAGRLRFDGSPAELVRRSISEGTPVGGGAAASATFEAAYLWMAAS